MHYTTFLQKLFNKIMHSILTSKQTMDLLKEVITLLTFSSLYNDFKLNSEKETVVIKMNHES